MKSSFISLCRMWIYGDQSINSFPHTSKLVYLSNIFMSYKPLIAINRQPHLLYTCKSSQWVNSRYSLPCQSVFDTLKLYYLYKLHQYITLFTSRVNENLNENEKSGVKERQKKREENYSLRNFTFTSHPSMNLETHITFIEDVTGI